MIRFTSKVAEMKDKLQTLCSSVSLKWQKPPNSSECGNHQWIHCIPTHSQRDICPTTDTILAGRRALVSLVIVHFVSEEDWSRDVMRCFHHWAADVFSTSVSAAAPRNPTWTTHTLWSTNPRKAIRLHPAPPTLLQPRPHPALPAGKVTPSRQFRRKFSDCFQFPFLFVII